MFLYSGKYEEELNRRRAELSMKMGTNSFDRRKSDLSETMDDKKDNEQQNLTKSSRIKVPVTEDKNCDKLSSYKTNSNTLTQQKTTVTEVAAIEQKRKDERLIEKTKIAATKKDAEEAAAAKKATEEKAAREVASAKKAAEEKAREIAAAKRTEEKVREAAASKKAAEEKAAREAAAKKASEEAAAQKASEDRRDRELEAARLRRKEEMAAKKKKELDESRKKIEEYNTVMKSASQVDIDRLEQEKSEKRKQFLEKAKLKKEAKREASLARNSSFRSLDSVDLKVEGPRSKKPTLAKSWRLEKSVQK